MRILFVTEKFPYPLDTGGNVRTYHLLRRLAECHDVTLICAAEVEIDVAHIRHIAEFCHDVRPVRVAPLTWRTDIAALVRSLRRSTPFIIGRRFHRQVAAEISEAFAATQQGNTAFDCVYFNHLDAAIYRGVVPAGVATVVDEHNVVSNQVSTTLTSETNLIRRAILSMDYSILRRYEAATCREMDLCLACSDADADTLKAMGVDERPLVIPNGVDLSFFTSRPHGPSRGNTLLFVGTMDYDPCEKGVWYFCNEILPLLAEQVPGIRFDVVGRNPSKRLKELARAHSHIRLHGRVEDVRTYLRDAAVVVVPLLGGSGTRLKILEAMAAAAPVVSTTIGAEGIDARSGEQLLLADDPRDFAAAVLRLLCEPGLATAIGTAGRLLVENQYGWTAIGRRLVARCEALATSRN